MPAATDRAFLRTVHGALLLAGGALFTLAIVALVERNGHFFADDFVHFYLVNTRPFWTYAFTPIDIHVVPLHRAASHLIYKLFPLNYHVALLVLLSFHVAALVYLYKTLQALKDTRLNAVLVFVYATNVYFFVPLLWWSSGIARFPYILFVLASMYHYIRFRKAWAPGHMLAVVVFFIGALGFYTKGFLIPAYLLGVEICLLKETRRQHLLGNLGFVCLLAALSVLCYRVGRADVSQRFAELHFNWSFLLEFEARSLQVLWQCLFTLVYRSDRTALNVAIGSVGVLFVLWTVIRRPYNLLVWCVGLGLVSMNILAVAISRRGARYGIFPASAPRYFIELVVLAVIFIGVVLQNLPRRAPAGVFATLRGRGASSVVGALGIAVYAFLSYSHSAELLERRYLAHRHAKSYVDNLLASSESLRANPSGKVAVIDGQVPGYLLPFGPDHIASHSTFLEIFGVRTSSKEDNATLYGISEHGQIERVPR